MISIPTLTVYTLQVRPTPILLCVHHVSVLHKMRWWGVIPLNPVRESICSTSVVALLAGGRFFWPPNRSWVAPSPFLSLWLPWVLVLEARDCCECLFVCLVVSAYGDQTWGISGCYSVAEDATRMGLCKSRDASQPVKLWSFNLSWHVEWFWAVVYLW